VVGDDWLYDEYAHGGGIANLDGAGRQPGPGRDRQPLGAAAPAGGERNRILDLFKKQGGGRTPARH
jgi:hypothetical protein